MKSNINPPNSVPKPLNDLAENMKAAKKTGKPISEADSPNDKYFRFYVSGYGMSQAYGIHIRNSSMKCSVSEEEAIRLIGQNLNGISYCSYGQPYTFSLWKAYFKPVYDERRDQYQNDPNNFDPDVNWPIDGDPNTGGWFRTPTDINVIDVTSSSATINWTTPEEADSWVIYTNKFGIDNGLWWKYKDSQQRWHYPDGYEHKDKVDKVTDHTITLPVDCPECWPLDPNTWYEFRIRSTNDTNEPPAVPSQIIWGYVGEFKTDPL